MITPNPVVFKHHTRPRLANRGFVSRRTIFKLSDTCFIVEYRFTVLIAPFCKSIVTPVSVVFMVYTGVLPLKSKLLASAVKLFNALPRDSARRFNLADFEELRVKLGFPVDGEKDLARTLLYIVKRLPADIMPKTTRCSCRWCTGKILSSDARIYHWLFPEGKDLILLHAKHKLAQISQQGISN